MGLMVFVIKTVSKGLVLTVPQWMVPICIISLCLGRDEFKIQCQDRFLNRFVLDIEFIGCQ